MMKRGRMELHEFDIGNCCTGAQCHGNSVTGGFKGIRGDGKDLTRSARSKQHISSPNNFNRSVGKRSSHSNASTIFNHKVECESVFVNFRCFAPHCSNECTLDFSASCNSTGMHDSRKRMSAFTGKLKLPVGIAIETRAKGNKITNPDRAFFDQHAHSVYVTKACARGQCVGEMQIGGIGIATEDRGHTTLGPTGRGLFKRPLGQHSNTNSGLSGCPHRGREPGHARTHYKKIEFSGHR